MLDLFRWPYRKLTILHVTHFETLLDTSGTAEPASSQDVNAFKSIKWRSSKQQQELMRRILKSAFFLFPRSRRWMRLGADRRDLE